MSASTQKQTLGGVGKSEIKTSSELLGDLCGLVLAVLSQREHKLKYINHENKADGGWVMNKNNTATQSSDVT